VRPPSRCIDPSCQAADNGPDATAHRHQYHCPYKGDASYYSIVTGSGELTDAVWTYEQPHAAVATIAGHVAFYPDRVQVSERA